MVIFAYLAAVILTLSACSNSDNDHNGQETHSNALLLSFASDYDTGELRWMDIDSTRLSGGALTFHQDSKISTSDEHIFILSRYPGVLTCISQDLSTIKQNRLEAGNPYEAVVIENEGYVTLNDEDYVQIFDPNTCAPTEKINLPIKDANASSIKASGDTLLVLLQRLKWEGSTMSTATPPGLLVRIKASTRTVIDLIQLNFYNPYASVLNDGKLYIAQSGLYDANMNIIIDGSGIDVVDLATGTADVLVTGFELGGGASSIALDKANQVLYAVAYESWRNAPVRPINLANKTVGNSLPNIIDAFGGIVFDEISEKLFVGERDLKNFGLKVYDPATNNTIKIRDDSKYPLPPYSLAIAR